MMTERGRSPTGRATHEPSQSPLSRPTVSVPNAWSTGEWAEGIVEWTEGNTVFISVVFSWDVDAALWRAQSAKNLGYDVRVGGPGVFTAKRAREFDGIAQVGGDIAGVQSRHNPMATKATTGCSKKCFFCIVPKMEGPIAFLPDFDPRPVLTDNNLSAIPAEYQEYIVRRYMEAGVPLLDANSGFEPETFTEEVFDRWAPINQGPWRFGLDETGETKEVEQVIKMLKRKGVPAKRIRPYVMIGHESVEECLARIQKAWELGAEPYVQYIIKLNARKKEPWVQHDWSAAELLRVQKWVNSHAWRNVALADFNPKMPKKRDDGRTIDWLLGAAA